METQITQENAGGNATFEKYKYKRWLLIVVGTLVMFSISLCNAWSVLVKPIAMEYPEWQSGLMMGLTVFMISYSICGILSGIIIGKRKGDAKLNLFISAGLLFTSFIISSLTNNLFLLYFSFGLLGGAGVIFAYNSILSVVTHWFQDMWGVASSILLMGYGLGSFLIGLLYSWINSLGVDWRIIFVVFGIFLAVVIVLAAFVIVLPPEDYKAPDAPKPKVDKYPIQAIECTPLEMIKRPSFWFNFIGGGCFLMMPAMAMSSAATNVVLSVSPETAMTTVSMIVGLISIFNAIGRIASGYITDWGGLRFDILVSAAVGVIATFNVAFAIFLGNLPYLVFSFIFFGLAAGMSVPDGAVVIQKLYGRKHYQVNLQVLMSAGIISSLGAILLPTFFAITGTFLTAFLVLGGIAFLGFICLLFVRKP